MTDGNKGTAQITQKQTGDEIQEKVGRTKLGCKNLNQIKKKIFRVEGLKSNENKQLGVLRNLFIKRQSTEITLPEIKEKNSLENGIFRRTNDLFEFESI